MSLCQPSTTTISSITGSGGKCRRRQDAAAIRAMRLRSFVHKFMGETPDRWAPGSRERARRCLRAGDQASGGARERCGAWNRATIRGGSRLAAFGGPPRVRGRQEAATALSAHCRRVRKRRSSRRTANSRAGGLPPAPRTRPARGRRCTRTPGVLRDRLESDDLPWTKRRRSLPLPLALGSRKVEVARGARTCLRRSRIILDRPGVVAA